jgi:hypothetical protein
MNAKSLCTTAVLVACLAVAQHVLPKPEVAFKDAKIGLFVAKTPRSFEFSNLRFPKGLPW